jgi:RNA polymerase sigma factor (sigma-70 family)
VPYTGVIKILVKNRLPLAKQRINLNRAMMSGTKLQFTDDQFIEGLRSGNSELLTALYKKYYNIVLKFIVNNSGTEEAAQDIYQETVIVLYENAQKAEFSLNCQLQTYIYSVAKRLWLKQLKKNGKTFLFKEEEENEVVDIASDLNEHHAKEIEIEKMNKSLLELGEPCATLIKDFYVHKLNMDEIANKFGYTNSDNAKNQKYKCLQRLKKYFFDKKIIEQE